MVVKKEQFPAILIKTLKRLSDKYRESLYVVGGTVRDWLSGIEPKDLDLAIRCNALDFARDLARQLKGTFVLLDDEEGVARVVWHDVLIDVADFKNGVELIQEDLRLRDFTINAMAFPLPVQEPYCFDDSCLIDPTLGRLDLGEKNIRAVSSRSFVDDPLRLLRAFRFHAETGFLLESSTWHEIVQHSDLIHSTSPERISYEFDCIMGSQRAYATCHLMFQAGLLGQLFPELHLGDGVTQPESHHLDVLQHNLQALCWMEKIIAAPGEYYPEQGFVLEKYLAEGKRRQWLKCAALFHDLGKPATRQIVKERITFYNHDRVGATIFETMARRLRWSNEKRNMISKLISLHMWPFHLSNVRRKAEISAKACLKLYKAAGEELPGLFLLTMADSLAGQGEEKPPAMEQELNGLFQQIHGVCERQVKPVLAGPRLVTGKDLVSLGLVPGPQFKEILEAVEGAQVAGEVTNHGQAMMYVREFLAKN